MRWRWGLRTVIISLALAIGPRAPRRGHTEEALHLPSFSHLLIVKKNISFILSLSLSLTKTLGLIQTHTNTTHTHWSTDTQTDEHTHSNTHAHTHTHKASTETQTHTNTHTNTDTYTFKACINIHFFLTLLSSIVLNNLSLSLSVAPLYPSLFFLSLPFFLYTSRSLRGQKRPGMCKKRPILSL